MLYITGGTDCMSNYDEMKGSLQALYDAARKEREALKKKLEEVEETLQVLEPVYGGTSKKKFSLETLQAAEEKHPRHAAAKVAVKKAEAPAKKQEGKKVRIKEEKIRESIIKYLTDVYPNSMSAGEIFEKLKKEGLPNTQSFRTRVYGKLGVWTKEGLLARPERGVYQIVKK